MAVFIQNSMASARTPPCGAAFARGDVMARGRRIWCRHWSGAGQRQMLFCCLQEPSLLMPLRKKRAPRFVRGAFARAFRCRHSNAHSRRCREYVRPQVRKVLPRETAKRADGMLLIACSQRRQRGGTNRENVGVVRGVAEKNHCFVQPRCVASQPPQTRYVKTSVRVRRLVKRWYRAVC